MPKTSEQLWLASVLHDEPYWPPESGCDPQEATNRILAAASAEGVLAPVFHKVRRSALWADLPSDLREAATQSAKLALTWELATRGEVVQVLDALAEQGIDALLLKGAGLAHTLYPDAHQRARGDTDLLLADRVNADRAQGVLEALGYKRWLGVDGCFVSNEFACSKPGPKGQPLTFDIHRKISNSHYFSRGFSFDMLWAERLRVDVLGGNAFMLSLPYTMLHALFHRAHHLGEGEPERLIWLYDIHLLSGRFDHAEWQRFAELAIEHALGDTCLDGLGAAKDTFGTTIPESIKAMLEASPGNSAAQAALRRPGIRRTFVNMGALPSWRDRVVLMKELLFPSRHYMAERFGIDAGWRLPYGYVRRAFRGVAKQLRRRRRN